jgi:repressor LexA
MWTIPPIRTFCNTPRGDIFLEEEMTPKQKLVFEFIKAYMEVKGYPPSYRNIAEGLNIKSKSNVHRLIHALKQEGLLNLEPHKIRSLKVVDKSVEKISSL